MMCRKITGRKRLSVVISAVWSAIIVEVWAVVSPWGAWAVYYMGKNSLWEARLVS